MKSNDKAIADLAEVEARIARAIERRNGSKCLLEIDTTGRELWSLRVDQMVIQRVIAGVEHGIYPRKDAAGCGPSWRDKG